jgi:hypothetical protein
MNENNDSISTAIRALAQHAVIAGLVRTHPDREHLLTVIEPFAEATRAMLLGSNWTDEQVHLFDNPPRRLQMQFML